MEEQLNIFDFMLQVSSYPKVEDIGITKAQLSLMIHSLKEYKYNLEKEHKNNLAYNAQLDFQLSRELKEITELIDYLEDKSNGGKKKNPRIRKKIEEDTGLETFSWL